MGFCTFGGMKVVVNARWLLPGKLEGTGMYTLRMLEHITAQKSDIEFVLLYDRPSAAKHPLLQGDNIKHRVVFPPARHPLLWHLWNRLAVPRALWKERADLYWSPDGLPARTSAEQWVTIHDLNFEHHPEWLKSNVARYYQREIRRAALEAQLLFTVSEWSHKDIAKRYEIPFERILLTPNASGREFQPGPVERQPYFCAVGAMTPRKNLQTLLRAFDQFKSRPGMDRYTLKIAGEAHFKDAALESVYAGMAHGGSVEFLGRLSERKLESLYQNATAFCMPSAMEGFGIPVIEAMQCGTAVISADNSALSEVVEGAGVLVDTYDVAAWAEAMAEMTTGFKRWREVGIARSTEYSWKQSAEQLVAQLALKQGRR